MYSSPCWGHEMTCGHFPGQRLYVITRVCEVPTAESLTDRGLELTYGEKTLRLSLIEGFFSFLKKG